jgi:hypothetical protein
MLGNIFGSSSDPNQSAMQYLQKIPGIYDQYYSPYTDAGTDALGTMQDQINTLLTDPTQMMDQIGGQYKESPGYQYNVDQATQGAMNAAAAGGQAGSPAEQQALANQISGMASQYYNQYMNQALGMYGKGFGAEQDIMHQGAQMSQQEAEALARNMMGQGAAAAGSDMFSNARSAGKWNTLGGMIGMGLGAL